MIYYSPCQQIENKNKEMLTIINVQFNDGFVSLENDDFAHI